MITILHIPVRLRALHHVLVVHLEPTNSIYLSLYDLLHHQSINTCSTIQWSRVYIWLLLVHSPGLIQSALGIGEQKASSFTI